MNSIKLQYKISTLFINSENEKTSDPHSLLLDFQRKNKLNDK